MKSALVWVRDHIVSSLLVTFIAAWFAQLSLDGIISAAAQSWGSLRSWTVDSIEVPRWQLLIALGGFLTIHGIVLFTYVRRVNSRAESNLDKVVTGLTDAFNKGAEDLASSPSGKSANISGPGFIQMKDVALAMELTKLEPEQRAILEYLARRYNTGKKHANSHEVARAIKLSVLRAEQELDKLHALGMIRDALNMLSGRTFYLGVPGREWLLANGHE